MKKTRILALMLCLMVCLSVVTGCNLITRNDKAYFEAIVATIVFDDGTKDEITKRELLMGYNSYGYNYEQNYGQTRKEAVKTTLDSIIDQHLTIKAVKDYYAAQTDPEEKKLFNDRETTYLWDTTYNSIYDNLLSYYNDIAGENSTTQSDNASENNLIYHDYDKKVYVDDDLILKKYETTLTIRGDKDHPENDDPRYAPKEIPSTGEKLDMEKEASKEYMYECIIRLFEGSDREAKNWKSAFNKYVSDIKKNYSYIEFKNDKECFIFELNRVYEILRDNYIVEKYSEIYNVQQHQGVDTATITAEDILKYYSSKARADFETYKNDRPGFDSKVLTDVANLEYIYDGNDQTDFFYVGYVKMNFDEIQKSEYEKAQQLTGTRKKEAVQKVYDSVYATVRDENGEKTSQKIGATKLLQDIQDALANKTVEQKAEEFRNYLYFYNDDDTLKNAEFNTVVGVRNGKEAVLPSAFADNEEAKDAIVKLFAEGTGSISDLVKASDGIYLFFNAGAVKNLFPISENFDASVDRNNIVTLANAKINIFSNKTYLDKLYDELYSDNFQIFRNMNIQYLRNKAEKIEAIENNFDDLY